MKESNQAKFQNALLLVAIAAFNMTHLPNAFAGTAELKTSETKKESASSEKTPAATQQKKPAASKTKSAEPNDGLPKVMDFGAKWCVPCRKFAPTFDKIGENYKGKVHFLHYDVESAEGKPLSEKYNVNVMPTILIVDGKGKVTWRKEGLTTEADLVKNTDAMLQQK